MTTFCSLGSPPLTVPLIGFDAMMSPGGSDGTLVIVMLGLFSYLSWPNAGSVKSAARSRTETEQKHHTQTSYFRMYFTPFPIPLPVTAGAARQIRFDPKRLVENGFITCLRHR